MRKGRAAPLSGTGFPANKSLNMKKPDPALPDQVGGVVGSRSSVKKRA